MTEPLIETRRLARRFGRRGALDGLDFTLAPGEIVGLVGPNGSGKTTFLKILAGFLRPTGGTARVFGMDPFRCRARVMERARFAFAPPPLYGSLTGREHLELLTSMRAPGAPPVGRAAVEEALGTAGLLDRAGDRVRAYSFGMRQRLALAQALLPRPRLLVLDEPTDGLDPLAILEVRGVFRRLREAHGVAILLATHLLSEADELVDRLLVLHEGRTLYVGAPAGLRRGGARLRLVVDEAPRAVAALRARGFAPAANGQAELTLPAGSLRLGEAAALLGAAGVKLQAFHEERPTLEQALLERLRAVREAGS